MDLPEVNSTWVHYNGTPYTVIHIANEPDDERYPCMIIYQGPNGKVWARKSTDWHRSMTESKEDSVAELGHHDYQNVL